MSLCCLLKEKLYPLHHLKDFTLDLSGVRYFDRALGKVKYHCSAMLTSLLSLFFLSSFFLFLLLLFKVNFMFSKYPIASLIKGKAFLLHMAGHVLVSRNLL